jgi:hypothetical protein
MVGCNVSPRSVASACLKLCLLADAEALDEEMETEEDLMEYCVDAMGYLLKMHRDGERALPVTVVVPVRVLIWDERWSVSHPAFLPIFEKYMAPAFEELLSEKAPDALLWNGLCIYVDVIEVQHRVCFVSAAVIVDS